MSDKPTTPLDWPRFRSLAGGDDAARDLAGFYIPYVVERLDALRSAVDAGAAEEVEVIAHQLAHSNAAAGVIDIVVPLLAIEGMAQEGHLGRVAAALADAEAGFLRVREFLLQYVEAVRPDARRSGTA
jgi:HPt (histidine-containing phosphotransfer) domain-containing protein